VRAGTYVARQTPLVREHSVPATTAFRGSCRGGHLHIAQWLVAEHRLTAELEDVRAEGNCVDVFGESCVRRRPGQLRFFQNCAHGRLEVVQWLVAVFNLTEVEAYRRKAPLSARPATWGHLAVAQWLAVTFNITAEDARGKLNDALHRSCTGVTWPSQWLAETRLLL
jgi:hypothetical protein